MRRGVLLNVTHETVVRLLPAMNITRGTGRPGLRDVADVLREIADEN